MGGNNENQWRDKDGQCAVPIGHKIKNGKSANITKKAAIIVDVIGKRTSKMVKQQK